MTPESVITFAAFLLLVAPGLLFELLRERRRPAMEETTFREASRIALASLAFSGTATGILAVVRILQPAWMPDPRRWLESGQTYVEDEYRLIVRAVVVEVVLALALAIAFDLLLRKRARGDMANGGIWYQLLRAEVPADKVPWVSLKLKNGPYIAGYVARYSTGKELDDREMVLKHNPANTGMKLQPQEAGSGLERLDGWDRVVVPGSEIQYWKLEYRPIAPVPTGVRSAQRGTLRLLHRTSTPQAAQGKPPSAKQGLTGTKAGSLARLRDRVRPKALGVRGGVGTAPLRQQRRRGMSGRPVDD
ncbi:hypothetical protein SAMN05660657_04463 [Geodermatophilus amargosae]|uniref:Uncharacterized protein n=1 Tax=Geodermatophilus amargosae TaxID=1296565 RepID=A0A1I7CGM2_9ACTN|nr:DUF6338 family protein [Geodermatophilus amargosae]SFT98588.1 hypothetical protein SAMN05660657_04463 [Geodermatophilus amargosae]